MHNQITNYHNSISVWNSAITQFQNNPSSSNKRNTRILQTEAGNTLHSIASKVDKEQWDFERKKWQDTYTRMVDTFKLFWYV